MKKLETYYIRTYGCQMNELDSEVLVSQLDNRGLKKTNSEDDADLIIFNTCSIRDLAERKVMGKLGLFSRGNKKNAIIGIAGCMAMTKKQALLDKFPYLNFILGTNNINNLNEVIDEVLISKKQVFRIDDTFKDNNDVTEAKRKNKISASVSIIRGCNNFCTYCVVPHTRGRELSRTPKSIIEECKQLVDKGYKQITLLGQNVNSFGKDQPKWAYLFPDLLKQLDDINGLERIRFMTSHPKDITIDLMKAIRDLPSVCEFVHFPVQSGSSRILKKMNRKYSQEQYLEKVTMIKEIVPNVSLGTDIIIGFPSETEEDFNQTCEIFEKVKYSVAFIFAYSPRKETAAIKWEDDVPKNVKQQRLQHLLKMHDNIGNKEAQKMIGSKQEILIESANNDCSFLKGRTRAWNKVVFRGDKKLIGSLHTVTLKRYENQTFFAE
jgi:tRNA-2-methylthio-N6-dimethylallyladenosine synthase